MRFGLHLALPFVAALLVAAAPVAKPKNGKFWYTYPQPPKVVPADPMRVFPGTEVPLNPQKWTWKIAAPANDKKADKAPVFDLSGGRLAKIGNLPLGTPVASLDFFKTIGRSIYYAVKFTPEGGTEKIAWVNGNFIAPSGLASVK